MKKFIYAILFALVVTASITSCTKEEVAPDKPGQGSAGDIKE
jgi:hypothetical protein